MKLEIKKTYQPAFDENLCQIGISMLQMKAVHLFIASNKWDVIEVEVCDEIPEGSLRFLRIVCSDIKVTLPEEITDKALRALIDIYPEKAGLLRKQYFAGKSIKEVLGECLL